jgi:hypothetical protein
MSGSMICSGFHKRVYRACALVAASLVCRHWLLPNTIGEEAIKGGMTGETTTEAETGIFR